MEIDKDEVFSVSEASKLVKNVIDTNLPFLWIEGEIANYVHHSSGHIYFSLKDDNSTIRCAFFRQNNLSLSFRPKNGDKVICYGKVDVYEKTGTYQLIARNMLPAGIGELQLKFLALKKKLEGEGLFSSAHKKILPLYPERIGVITSPTGAAFQDIKNVLSRRYPHKIYLYPAGVQGQSSVPELISGLRFFNSDLAVDLIIIGRGGGSQEDLFCFNDERLARAIFASKIPVISAVGHEIDFTIADFVADLRAPTPSAAAELAVPNKDDLIQKLISYQKQLVGNTERYLLNYRNKLNRNEKVLYQWHPRSVLYKYQQRLDEAVNTFSSHLQDINALRQQVENLSGRLLYLSGRITAEKIYKDRLNLAIYSNRLANITGKSVESQRTVLQNFNEQLNSLSPNVALRRGYAIIRREKKILNSVGDIKPKDQLEIKLKDGSCQCLVEEVISEK